MHCLNPVTIRNPHYNPFTDRVGKAFMAVPCGKCPACQDNYVNMWFIRLKEACEDFKQFNNFFITLTYDEEHVPLDTETGEIFVKYPDVQYFWKRLKKRLERYKSDSPGGYKRIRYFCVSEFGSETNRPHYHAIVIGSPISDMAEFHKLIEDTWGLGFVQIGYVNNKTLRYVLKYLNKDMQDAQNFHSMSKGLGVGYVDRFKKFHKRDVVNNNCYHFGPSKTRLPRYYREKIFNEHERKLQNKHSDLLYEQSIEEDTHKSRAQLDEEAKIRVSSENQFLIEYYSKIQRNRYGKKHLV